MEVWAQIERFAKKQPFIHHFLTNGQTQNVNRPETRSDHQGLPRKHGSNKENEYSATIAQNQCNALILQLKENIKGNVFNSPFPFIAFKRVSSSEKLAENLKKDGDPWTDYFITLDSYKANVSSRNSSSSSM